MDLVILYKKSPSTCEDEIRFTIRSMEKYVKFDNLIVIGDRPSFLNAKAIYINLTLENDGIKRDCLFKHIDMLAKAKAIIADERISNDFIWSNDDFIILQPQDRIPYYYNRTLEEWHDAKNNNWEMAGGFKSNTWIKYINEVYEVFPEGNWYEVHYPIVFNKKKLDNVIRKYKLEHLGVIRSFYCNNYKTIKGEQIEQDYKIYTVDDFKKYKKAPFISTTNAMGRFEPLIQFLAAKFPQKSSYEK